MIKEALQYLVSLKENKTYEINGDVYSEKELVRIPPYVARPARISVTGLDSIVKLVRNELDMFENLPVFIRVDGARSVSVFTTYDGDMARDDLYEARCDVPGFYDGFRGLEAADIAEAAVLVGPPDVTLELEGAEIGTLAELLGDVRITRPDQSYTEYAGQTVLFTLTMTDGTKTSVGAFNPFLIIDGTGYRTAYEPCEALNRFANELLRERGG